MKLRAELSFQLSIGEYELGRIIESAPARYKVYPVAKRNGGRPRIIAQPASELKEIQRIVVADFLSGFPVHDAAMAYVKRRNIKQNAESHLGAPHLLKIDFERFFNSITVANFRKFIKSQGQINISPDEQKDLERILFWSGEKNSRVPRILSIGAPSSPMMSNVLLYDLDVRAHSEAMRVGVTYTRYADDVIVSGPSRTVLLGFERFFRRSMREIPHLSIRVNEEKRGLYGPGQRHFVTGLVTTPDGHISIGRDRKREIKALLHKLASGDISVERRAYLKGILGFAVTNEPLVLARMRAKYGNDVVDAAMSYVVPPRRRLDP